MVAALARVAGYQHLELVEDAVQSAFTAALETWRKDGVPADPESWLHRVARNRLVGDLRQRAGRQRILEQVAREPTAAGDTSTPAFVSEVRDDMLRMLFVCCDEAIPFESRLVLALKTLCGFGTSEIALRLFTTEANVHKRLARARERLREPEREFDTPALTDLRARLPGVQSILYLLFNEGYLAMADATPIRGDLCEEAIRLTTLLAEHEVGAVPETFALVALMHLHTSRLGSRLDGRGGLLLLEEQDRTLWDRNRMQLGMQWLARAATGETFSRFHAEAGIAAEHCLAPTFGETKWQEIAELYALLETIAPSPIHTMNRAVAVAECCGPEVALALLDGLMPPSWLAGSYLWAAVLGDLHRRAGSHEAAERYHDQAVALAPTESVRALLRRRFATTLARK
jgi:RNA polymerase sigma factor (sigma-70 family)